ncbi:MAG: hypothetical protein C0503_12225 [Gemmatimonas sp.]|nr:hypothetical protein [Gemmatimonas sp.]
MTASRHASTMIYAGIVASLLTMAFHPTGSSVLADAEAGGGNVIARGTHLLAILAQPLLLTAMGILSWRLRDRAALAGLGFASYALSAFAIIIAAAMSGLVAPRLAEILVEVAAADKPGVMQQWYLSHTYNQVFAQISVIFTGVAILSWSAAMRTTGAFPRGLSTFGLVIGAIGTFGALFNLLPLDIHRYGLIVLVQSIWMAGVAVTLRKDGA